MTHVNPASFRFLWLLLVFIPLAMCGRIPGQKARGIRLGKIGASLLVAVILMIGSTFAIRVLNGYEPEPPWEPELPPPIKDPENDLPQGPGSFLRSFSLSCYNLKKTTASDEKNLRIGLIDQLDEHKENCNPYKFPEGVVVRGKEPTDAFKVAESFSEYDGQILDAFNKINTPGRSDIAYQYHRISVTGLNCLDSLSKQCKEGKPSYREERDNFLYYGELVVWALVNEYIYSDLTSAELVDLFYRIAQAYDHVGTAATDEDPPFRHEMYFIAAAFLELSFRSLKSIDFRADGHEYRSSVWNLYMTMHFRMGKYVEEHEGFFKNLENCKTMVSPLLSTDKEKADVQERLDELQKWRLLH